MGARFSIPVQTGPGAHTASYTIDTGSFPGVQRTGRDVNHPPPLRAEVKQTAELYLYSPLGLHGKTSVRTVGTPAQIRGENLQSSSHAT